LDYLEHCARKYGLAPHTRFGAEVREARWDEGSNRWIVRNIDGGVGAARWARAACGAAAENRIAHYRTAPVLSPRISIKRQRWWLRRIALMGRPTPDQQTVEAGTVGGVSGEWIRPLQLSAATERGAAILYLHGVAYCVGAPATHRAITLQLGRRSRLPVFAADYRLAPEHRFRPRLTMPCRRAAAFWKRARWS